MASRPLTVLLASFLASSAAFVHVGIFARSCSGPLSLKSDRYHSCRSQIRLPVRCAAEGVTDGEGELDEEGESVDESLEGVAKMRASEIKAELEMRGVSYEGIFEKTELVEKLIEARSLGRANPSLIDDFNKENLERKMDPEKAAAFADDLLDADKLKDMTAADGTLPGGMTPETLSKLVSNPELMVLMQNPKLQEVMKKVMAGGPQAMENLQKDPETAELLQKLEKAMGPMK
eukprot:jgi/Undpi1/8635/HiC_scaffold_25.g11100.m1